MFSHIESSVQKKKKIYPVNTNARLNLSVHAVSSHYPPLWIENVRFLYFNLVSIFAFVVYH
ncbi:hypothetical protein PGB90_005728 [Kerria lacca]